ncbi:hypothetical protein BWK60_07670 [Flavobacterium covae]|uniref:hypothetical protein n=1 Tax=Flavobacterium covae TaxID=2906076 RepID=UPI000B4D495C|nr:hypothetical protein [Flavobacterium covae]OWP86650.1 hypothetical protein BWK60_07670 [Flavobacterium covae]
MQAFIVTNDQLQEFAKNVANEVVEKLLPSITPPKPLLNQKQAMAYTGLCQKTLYNYEMSGRLVPNRESGNPLYNEDQLKHFKRK